MDQKLADGDLSEEVRDQLIKASATVGWNESEVDRLIDARRLVAAQDRVSADDAELPEPESEIEIESDVNAAASVTRVETSTDTSVQQQPPINEVLEQRNSSSGRWVVLVVLILAIAGGGYGYVEYQKQEEQARLEAEQLAQSAREEQAAWTKAESEGTIVSYETYLELPFAKSTRKQTAREAIQVINDAAAAAERQRIAELEAKQTEGTKRAIEQKRIDQQKEADRRAEAQTAGELQLADQEKIEAAKLGDDVAWSTAESTNTSDGYQLYRNSEFATKERTRLAEERVILLERQRTLTEAEYQPIVKVAPLYPQRALSRGMQGWVLVEFEVNKTGAVVSPRVVDNCGWLQPKAAGPCVNSPNGVFDSAALRAVQKFKYAPRMNDGAPIRVSRVQNKITFELLFD